MSKKFRHILHIFKLFLRRNCFGARHPFVIKSIVMTCKNDFSFSAIWKIDYLFIVFFLIISWKIYFGLILKPHFSLRSIFHSLYRKKDKVMKKITSVSGHSHSETNYSTRNNLSLDQSRMFRQHVFFRFFPDFIWGIQNYIKLVSTSSKNFFHFLLFKHECEGLISQSHYNQVFTLGNVESNLITP